MHLRLHPRRVRRGEVVAVEEAAVMFPVTRLEPLEFILLLFPNRMGFGSARTESHSVRLSVLPCQCSVYRLCSQRWN